MALAEFDSLQVGSDRVGNDFFPPFSDEEMRHRHERVRHSMRERGIGLLLVYGAYTFSGPHPGHINAVWLANYCSIAQTYVVFPDQGDPAMIISVPYQIENAQEISVIKDIRAGGSYEDHLAAFIRERNFSKGHIGVVGPNVGRAHVTVPVEHDRALRESFPDACVIDATDWFNDLRLEKSDEERELMRRAGAITDQAMEAIVSASRVGARHTDLRRAFNIVAAKNGASYPFGHLSSMSTNDPRPDYPDYYPTHRAIEAGDVVMTECVMGYGNYWGKLWVSFFVGEPANEYAELFDIAAEVHSNAAAGIRPGMRTPDVDEFLTPLQKAGLEQVEPIVNGWSTLNHPPFLGEPVSAVASRSDTPHDSELLSGQTVTVKCWPRIPGTRKGLWVGSTYIVGEDGLESIHKYPVNERLIVLA